MYNGQLNTLLYDMNSIIPNSTHNNLAGPAGSSIVMCANQVEKEIRRICRPGGDVVAIACDQCGQCKLLKEKLQRTSCHFIHI